MGSIPPWNYGGPPAGQPTPLQDGEWQTSAPRPPLFGQQYKQIAGIPRSIVLSNPAAGAEWSYKHSGPSWLLLRSVIWQLVTSAVVGSRASRLQLKLGPDLVAQFPPTAVQAASLTVVYTAMDCGVTSGDPATIAVGTSSQVILADNMSIGTNTSNKDVGDQYSAIALYVEEFTDACL